MSTTVRVSIEAKKKFAEIRKKNPQYNTDAEVFDHILQFYIGKTVLPLETRHLMDALKEKQLAPTKNNEFQIVKSDK